MLRITSARPLALASLLVACATQAAAFSLGGLPVCAPALGASRAGICAQRPAFLAAAAPRTLALSAPMMAAAAAKSDAPKSDAPKRPLSAYFLFVGQNRVAVKTANPLFKSTQIVQELGAMWRGLKPADKAVYEEQAAKAKAEYVAKYGSTTKAPKEKAGPKKPLSSYMIFSSETRPSVVAANPTMKFGDVAKALGEKWRAMSDAQKAPYKQKEETLKAEFEKLQK
ncbi:high mobility group box domain-containing protein [Baffinella frigidus]|nr:high mobility group box domain-containing protein [Cryptophyta sp. CCMP2293]